MPAVLHPQRGKVRDGGQTLDRLLSFLEVRQDITLSQLDPTGYDIVSLCGQHFRFANGREAFIDQMSGYFPQQRDALERYFDLVDKVASASSMHSLNHVETDAAVNLEFQMRTINEVIDSTISDPLLAKVLVGNLPLYAAEKDKTPFATHAFIMDFYNQSAYRIVGGSDQVAASLVKTISRYGGRVLTRSKATKIVCDDTHGRGGARYVCCRSILVPPYHRAPVPPILGSRYCDLRCASDADIGTARHEPDTSSLQETHQRHSADRRRILRVSAFQGQYRALSELEFLRLSAGLALGL